MGEDGKLLVISQTLNEIETLAAHSLNAASVDLITTASEGIAKLMNPEGDYKAVFISGNMMESVFKENARLEHFLELLSQGIMVLDKDANIIYANRQLAAIARQKPILNEYFYKTLPNLDFDGPHYCPLTVARSTKEPVLSSISNLHGKSYQFRIVPILDEQNEIEAFIVSLEDVTPLTVTNQKLQALHDAAGDLVDLAPEELFEMNYSERIEFLKTNILMFIEKFIHVEVFEIRLIDQESPEKELMPLLNMGLSEEAAWRRLYVSADKNGVTGFVAKLGTSYSVEDIQDDPLFIPSTNQSKSAFTVPLKFHDTVIGTLNVESFQPRAFTAVDQLLIKLLARDIAVALHTLELLSAEKTGSVAASAEAIHAAVALPIDQILNDAVSLNDRYIGLGLEPELSKKLERILENARYIKSMIHKVGEQLTPSQAHPTPPGSKRPILVGKRILVVDDDKSVLQSAHTMLAHYGCTVETADNGANALLMARNVPYDLFIGAIKLSDMDGCQFMQALTDLLHKSPPPYIMMVGFGYDSNHTRVKANQSGLQATLFKPFRLDQLLNTVERILSLHQE
ncbi:MAG: response regulator [Planctomycetaceae bacterium]|nr:response regulator [Planctomycetaceae bacterium]